MTALEQLQHAASKLREVNEQPLKTQNEVEKLRKEVDLLNKVVVAIIKTLSQDEQDKIKTIVNSTDKSQSV